MIKRTVYSKAEIKKCDLCKEIRPVQFRFDFLTVENNYDFIDFSLMTCKECAKRLSSEVNLSEVKDEYVLSEEAIF